MTVPANIIEMLQTKNVDFAITDIDERSASLSLVPKTNAQAVVKSVLLHDGKNVLQALVGANRIIDLDAMFRQFRQNFDGLTAAQTWKIAQSKKHKNIPAFPKWQGMKTYVDDSVLKADKILLDTGGAEKYVSLSVADFETLVKDCQIGAFTAEAHELAPSADNDEAEIVQSVEKFTERRIRQRLDETLELPPLPETAQRIIKLRADPEADISDLTNIVEIDPSLAAQVVSWAASPYYSAPGKIKSVHDAIVRVLGFDMVLNLALGLALGKSLSMKAISQEQLNAYWREAVYTAAAVEGLITSIAREHRPGFGMAYLSGLLNSIGYLVMAEIFPPYARKMERQVRANPHIPSALVEHQLMGVSGSQVASWLMENWNMPDEVVVALRQQVNIAYDGEHQKYAKLIFVAKQMLANNGFGQATPIQLPTVLFDDLKLDPDTANETILNILESGEDLDLIAENMRG